METLALRELQLPTYKIGKYGRWEILLPPPEQDGMILQPGYYTPIIREQPFHYLRRDGVTWMCTSRLEQESHQYHLNRCHGKVLICGIGMGMFLYNAALLDSVESIVAVDIDDEIIELLKTATDFDNWPGRSKITLVHGDALKYMPDFQPDYMYIDIWPNLMSENTITDVRTIQANINAKIVGWWGQELDFVNYLAGRKAHNAAAMEYHEFQKHIGVPMDTDNNRSADIYAAFCIQVARCQIFRSKLETKH